MAQIRAAATSGKEETSEIQPSPTFDPETLRQVSALCSLLSAATRTAASTSDPSVDVTPVEGQPGIRMELEQELRAEHQDVLLTNQLSTLTSSLHSLNEVRLHSFFSYCFVLRVSVLKHSHPLRSSSINSITSRSRIAPRLLSAQGRSVVVEESGLRAEE